MKKTITGMEAKRNAVKALWNGLGHSLAGPGSACVCISCGTALLGKERSLFGRGLSNLGDINAANGGYLNKTTNKCITTNLIAVMAGADRQRKGYANLGKFVTYAMIGLAAAYGAMKPSEAKADPIMSINTTYSVDNHDGDALNIGDETLFRYTVANISSENINDNNLIEFYLPGGSNQGVFHANSQDFNWAVEILNDTTKFTGNGEYIGVGGDLSFDVYSSRIDGTRLAFAQATAAGDHTGTLDFNNVEVVSPIPEPAVLTSILLAGGALLAGRRIFGQEPA